jgi:hypothetical protein
MEPMTGNKRGLLVICRQQRDGENLMWRINRHLNVLNEEYFLSSWPDSVRVIDDRDPMHERGWTYFEVDGEIAGRRVSGRGRLPFVYAAARVHYPWLELSVGGRPAVVDTPAGARIYDGTGRVSSRPAGGSFFAGLPRPWTGLHAIDTIRRDAAEQRLRFETTYDSDNGCATITAHAEDFALIYTVNLEMDVVEAITFCTEATAGPTRLGELHFTYLQEADEVAGAFAAPANVNSGSAPRQKDGMLWLRRLIKDL